MQQTEVKVSKRIEKILKDKVTEHNKDNPKYRATLGMLKAVFRRGVGAYNTNPSSVRPTVTSSDQWALARVNGFLYALRNGKFKRAKYDTDLLPSNHPLSSKKSFDGKAVGNVPSYIRANARRGLDSLEFAGDGLTDKTKREARDMANGNISEGKVVRMNAWFLRHVSDLESPRANEYLRGEGKMTAGQVAWLLWGGSLGSKGRMKAQQWAERQVARLEREKNFASARELIERRSLLREAKWDVRLNRFRTKQSKDSMYDQFDELLGNWDFALARQYFGLLDAQRKTIDKFLAENSPTIVGVQGLVNFQIDKTTKQWQEDLVDVYQSMTVDFAYLQTGFLLPDEKADDNYVFTTTEQERITRARRRKPRKEIIEEGFYPRRRGGAQLPIDRQAFNKKSAKFVQDRLDNLLPDMAKTQKNNLNRALRKSIDEVADLGLTGKKAEDFMRKEISKVLSKKNLGRAMTIARTEGTALANYGMNQSAKATGIPTTKEWLTQRDGRVRDAHLSADGTEVGENEAFLIQGYKLNYPADTSFGAPPSLVCNCRCTVIYHEKRI